ncbi:sodium-dependent glucose transporter 1-like [Haliotis cracherodii]|uniref:sodium-dependent glucose transporter 1-like n=1 Tax=Haliotis cracherodii TaxID=6455 RepID=UPI0039EC8A53
MSDCILGTTLLDLQLLLQTDLDSLSYLFLVFGLGAVAGSVLSGALATRFSTHLQLGIALIIGCAAMIAIPLVMSLPLVYFLVCVYGMSRGSNTMQAASQLWDKKGGAFQFIICASSFAAVQVPLIAKPFLAVGSDLNTAVPVYKVQNHSENWFEGNETTENFPDPHLDSRIPIESTHVQWVYFICGMFILPSGLAQFYYWIKERQEAFTETTPYNHVSDSDRYTSCQMIFVVCLLFMFFLIGASTVFLSSMLTVYGVHSDLHMAKTAIMSMTSLISISSLVTRSVSLVSLRFITHSQLLVVCLLGEILGGTVLSLSASAKNQTLLWIAVVLLGGCAGPLLAACLARTSEVVTLHPLLISSSFVANGVGITLFPFLGGLLFVKVGPETFVYLYWTLITGHVVVFVLMEAAGRLHVRCSEK